MKKERPPMLMLIRLLPTRQAPNLTRCVTSQISPTRRARLPLTGTYGYFWMILTLTFHGWRASSPLAVLPVTAVTPSQPTVFLSFSFNHGATVGSETN